MLRLLLALVLLVAPAFAAAAAARVATSAGAAGGGTPPLRTAALDAARRLDVNRLDLWTSNFGWLAVDTLAFDGGLEFPRGSGRNVIFASGLWIGAKVDGTPRVTVSEYSTEWRPGRIVAGIPEPPGSPALRSWKVIPVGAFRDAADSVFLPGPAGTSADAVAHEAWADYRDMAVPTGAPVAERTVRVAGAAGDSVAIRGPNLRGELALWSVFNDADAAAHVNNAGRTTPLGLEVEQWVYGYANAPPGVAFVTWTIRHRGTTPLDSVFVTFWVDPDLGSAADDLVGWDSLLQMGYVYNATNADGVYGARPPAVGVRLLGGSSGNDAGAFDKYIGGTDPASALESWRLLQGFELDGDPWIDPSTLEPTRFPFSGDPVTGTGWLDTQPADRRFLVSARPFDFAPGGQAQFHFAIVVGQGFDRIDSIRRLRCQAALAREVANAAFVAIFPARLTLTEATATAGAVRLAWRGEGPHRRPLELLHHAGATVDPWPDASEFLGTLAPDEAGTMRFDGAPLAPGERRTYGLFDPCDPLAPLARVELVGPGEPLAFRVSSPVTTGAPVLHFTLPAPGRARLEAFSVTGRRLLDVDLGPLAHGPQSRTLSGTESWPAGVYLFRLTQEGSARAARAVLLR